MDPSTTILWWWALGTPSTSKYVNLECLKFFNSVFSNPRGSIASGGQGYFTHSSYDYNTGYSRTNYKDWTELDWGACLSSHVLKWSICDKFFIDLKEYSIINYLFNQPNSIALYSIFEVLIIWNVLVWDGIIIFPCTASQQVYVETLNIMWQLWGVEKHKFNERITVISQTEPK